MKERRTTNRPKGYGNIGLPYQWWFCVLSNCSHFSPFLLVVFAFLSCARACDAPNQDQYLDSSLAVLDLHQVDARRDTGNAAGRTLRKFKLGGSKIFPSGKRGVP